MFGIGPGTTALETTLNALEGRAYMEDLAEEVYVRLAAHEGALYLDLCNAAWEVVRIAPNGWEVMSECPVNFRRARGALPLPTPVHGGSLDELRQIINIGSDENWTLLVAWLLSTLHPTGPYPVLTFAAEQGSAKSTTARFLRETVDPNAVPLLGVPRDSQTLTLQANSNWIVALDNLSSIPQWLSDDLCRLATGGGNSKKQLYVDSDLVLYNVKRPVIITGIGDLATKGDLLERMVMVNPPSIPESKRRSEVDINARFQEARPRILGALLDAVSAALKNYRDVRLEEKPRMADFAIWVTAAEEALGWQPRRFMNVYGTNRESATGLELEASAVARAVRKFMVGKKEWIGTATDLLNKLEDDSITDLTTRRQPAWPKAAHILSTKLTQHAPALRRVGLDVTISHSGNRTITIRQIPADQTRTNNGPVRDASDAPIRPSYPCSPKEEKEREGMPCKGASGASNHELPEPRPPCAACAQVMPPNRKMVHCEDGKWRCSPCFGKMWWDEGTTNVCPDCADTLNFRPQLRAACAACGKACNQEEMSRVGDDFYCLACETAILTGDDPRDSVTPEEALCEHPDEHRPRWTVYTHQDGSTHVLCGECAPF